MVRNIFRVMHWHSGDKCFPPVVLAWEAFQKVTLIAPRVASEASKLNGEELDVSQGCYQVNNPWYTPTRLSGRTRRDEYSACVSQSNQEGKAFGVNSVYTPI